MPAEQLEMVETCPVCQHDTFSHFIDCRDHTVSKDTFRIVECDHCGFKFTNPRPDANNLYKYYESEDYISHSNTKEGIINKIYHLVREYTLRKKEWSARNLSQNGRGHLLDYGCGTGEYLRVCRNKGWNAKGLEPDSGAREFASNEYDLDVRDVEQIEEFESDYFDIITLWHVIEHVPDLRDTIRSLRRVLSPSGTLIVAAPNCSSLDAEMYGEFWAAYDVPRHLYHFRPRDMRGLFDRMDMTVSDVRPMTFDSYYVSMLSERYRDGNLFKGVVYGLISNLSARLKTGNYSSQMYVIKK